MPLPHVPTVLISDDEPLIVSALARLARKVGLHYLSDTTSEHVLELARSSHPDVIVLDVNQKKDGRDLLAALKRDPATASIKVVMLSGRDDQFVRHQCFELGAEDYVLKPFDPLFIHKIARMCGLDTEQLPSTGAWTPPPTAATSLYAIPLAPVKV